MLRSEQRPASATPTLPLPLNAATSRPRTAKAFKVTEYIEEDPVKLYRNNEHFPGYAGHVPKLSQTFGTRFTMGTRYALQAPPAPASRPISAYDPKRGRRVMQTPHLLPGNTFSGLAEPTRDERNGEPSGNSKGLHTYLQGSHVDVPSYYDSLRANNYDKLLIKSGFPDKARSNVEVGDRFYLNGPHMWQTTYKESFQKEHGENRPTPAQTESPQTARAKLLSTENTSVREKTYNYKVLQALVGQRRLDHLQRLVRSKLAQITNSGRHEAVHMFKVYDDDQSGFISPERFLRISRSLGIHMTATEAGALFGRFDKNSDNEITFYEFLDEFMGVDGVHKDYYAR